MAELPRGVSIRNDFRALLNDERFFDVSLKCSDDVLGACKNILATRSEVFNRIFLKKEDDSYEFDDIPSIAMKVILKFLHTSNVGKEHLTDKSVIEVYHAAIYFELGVFQKYVIEFTKMILNKGDDDLGKRLLSDCVEKFSLDVDNTMSNLLVDWVSLTQLFPKDGARDSLSLKGLQYLLMKTYDTTIPFLTYELDLFEYAVTKTKHFVSKEMELDFK